MKHLRLLLLFTLFTFLAQAQTPTQTTLAFDSTFVKKTTGNGNAELILMNGSRGKTGAFLQNRYQGRTQYSYAIDTAYKDGSGNLILHRGDGNLNLGSMGGTTLDWIKRIDTLSAERDKVIIWVNSNPINSGYLQLDSTLTDSYIQDPNNGSNWAEISQSINFESPSGNSTAIARSYGNIVIQTGTGNGGEIKLFSDSLNGVEAGTIQSVVIDQYGNLRRRPYGAGGGDDYGIMTKDYTADADHYQNLNAHAQTWAYGSFSIEDTVMHQTTYLGSDGFPYNGRYGIKFGKENTYDENDEPYITQYIRDTADGGTEPIRDVTMNLTRNGLRVTNDMFRDRFGADGERSMKSSLNFVNGDYYAGTDFFINVDASDSYNSNQGTGTGQLLFSQNNDGGYLDVSNQYEGGSLNPDDGSWAEFFSNAHTEGAELHEDYEQIEDGQSNDYWREVLVKGSHGPVGTGDFSTGQQPILVETYLRHYDVASGDITKLTNYMTSTTWKLVDRGNNPFHPIYVVLQGIPYDSQLTGTEEVGTLYQDTSGNVHIKQ